MRDAKTWVTHPKLAGNAGLNEGGEGVPRLEKVRRTG